MPQKAITSTIGMKIQNGFQWGCSFQAPVMYLAQRTTKSLSIWTEADIGSSLEPSISVHSTATSATGLPVAQIDNYTQEQLCYDQKDHAKYYKVFSQLFSGTTFQSLTNTKLSPHRFQPCHENGLIKTLQTIPHNLYVCFKLSSLYCGLRLILVYPNPQ